MLHFDMRWPWQAQLDAWFFSWLLAVVVTLLVALVLRRVGERMRRRWRARSARAAERRARRLLEAGGYFVLEAQAVTFWPVLVGRRSLDVALRADYLVGRGGERYVAEVKSGGYVARIRHGPTRRQLLEYRVAYRVDGVLLVDVARERIEKVDFPALKAR